MPSVVIDKARGGTLCVGGVIFGRGETPIPEDRDITVDDVERACEDLPWARVRYRAADEPEPEPERQIEEALRAERGLPEPEPALPVSSERDVAAAEVDEQKATRAEKLAELVEKDRKPDDGKAKREWPCPHCDKVLRSASGLRQHVQLKHTS